MMSLKIYDWPDPSTAFSEDGSLTNPLAMTFDGAEGGVVQRRCYVRNDDVLKTYSGIELTPVDSGDDIVDGSTGFSWKLREGDQQPLDAQWDLVTPGNTLEFSSDISDTNTYLPFWIRVEVPRGASVDSFQGVTLDLVADEATA
jgi:hypothetical protein